jgi:Tfp pilus assembly protein PilN
MNGVNLIPLARVQHRRRAARLRLWMVITPVCASLLAGAYGWVRAAWSSDVDAIASEIAKTEAGIQATEKEDSVAKARIAELQPKYRAARAVGDQPDWGALLSLIATRLGNDTVLSSCSLVASAEPAPTTQPATPSKNPGKAVDAKSRDSGRPERFTLALTGVARTQEAVSLFVSGLEGVGLFDRVAIAEARRTAVAGQEGVTFRVECTLSDSVTEAP